jgi:hypothetical protein
MKIVIDNTEFDYNTGCRLLKTKYGNTTFNGLEDIWEHIVPITFKEIATDILNIEQRRIAVNCLGLEKIYEEVNPELIQSTTLKKETYWVDSDGNLVRKVFDDTYELYQVSGKVWSEGIVNSYTNDVYFVKCKDTSTDRNYFIWVDRDGIARTNPKGVEMNSIQAIAWTIQTDIELGGIEKIVRQGDCILIKKTPDSKRGRVRHLTENEYRELLVLES